MGGEGWERESREVEKDQSGFGMQGFGLQQAAIGQAVFEETVSIVLKKEEGPREETHLSSRPSNYHFHPFNPLSSILHFLDMSH